MTYSRTYTRFKSLFLVALSCGFLAACLPESDQGAITVSDAFSFATTDVQKNGAVFLTITNTSKTDGRITAARSDVSEAVELHTHLMDGDVMMMREVDGYDIPAGESVTLQPMGHHIMLMGLNAPLNAGESFALTLEDANGVNHDVDVMIKNPGDISGETK